MSCAFVIPSVAQSADDADRVVMSVVTGLGFIDEEKIKDDDVTRGEFATIALNLYGIDAANKHEYGVDTPFTDVTAEHYKSADILSVSKMGIMNGYGDGYFHPERTVAFSEAVKVIMDLLGYREYIAYVGGYPVGYMAEANKAGITKGIDKSYEAPLTYGELAEIIYNAIDTPLVQISGIGQDSVDFGRDESVTFTTKYHDTYKAEGVVSATSVTKLNSAYEAGSGSDDTIEINGTVFYTPGSAFSELLGLNVEYYYKNEGNHKKLVYAVDKDNETVEFSGDSVVSAKSDSIEVWLDNGKKQSYSLEETGNVIYNGVFNGKILNYPFNNAAASLSNVSGNIRLVDTNGNSKYDAVFVTDYKNYLVDKVSEGAQKFILKNNTDYVVVEFSDSNIFLNVTEGGKQTDILSVDNGSLVSVADSADAYMPRGGKRFININVCTETVNASVSEISDEGVYLMQKGSQAAEFYEVAESFFGQNGETGLTNRANGIFYIDISGKIAYYTTEGDSALVYGYILNAGVSTTSIDDSYGIKLLSQSGDILCLYAAENIKLDGRKVAYRDINANLERSANIDGTVKQLVRYRVNADGFISEIDTSMPNASPEYGELEKKHVSGGATYKNNMKTFVMSGTDERYILSNEVKLFLIPTDPQAKDEDYQVRSASYFSNNTSYGASGEKLYVYNVEEAEPQAMELQISKAALGLGGVSQYNSDLAVVIGHSRIADESGEEFISLRVMVTNAEKKLRLDPNRVKLMRFEEGSVTSGTFYDYDGVSKLTIDSFKFGDLVLFYEDENGETRTVLKVNDTDPRTWKHGSYGIQQKGGYLERMYAGVKKATGRKLLLDVSSETNPEREIYANLLGSLQVYLVDFTTQTVRTASFDDIIFSEDDTISDKVFVRTRAYVPKQVVIYRGKEVRK